MQAMSLKIWSIPLLNIGKPRVLKRAKGIVAKPMPEYWYDKRDNLIKDGDTEEVIKQKEFNQTIAAPNKPYFMIYVYPALKKKTKKYEEDTNHSAIMKFSRYGINTIQDLYDYDPKNETMQEFISSYENKIPVSQNNCVVNRICRLIESEFSLGENPKNSNIAFDYSILKSNAQYSRYKYNEIANLYEVYKIKVKRFIYEMKEEKFEDYQMYWHKEMLLRYFVKECSKICSNEFELCNILIDLCYGTENGKQFVWDICGQTIIRILMNKYENKINYPKLVDVDGDFEYCGNQLKMEHMEVIGEEL